MTTTIQTYTTRTLLLLAATLLAACAGSDGPEGEPAGGKVVTFGATAVATRADDSLVSSDSYFPKGGQMGVFAYYNHPDGKPDFMLNQPVTYEGDDSAGEHIWTYAPIKYWPNNADDKVSFIGYYPHNGDNGQNGITFGYQTASESLKNTAGQGNCLPRFAFHTQTNSSEQVDFMVSGYVKDQPRQAASEKVTLAFSHALSQIVVRVNGADATSITISDLHITEAYADGTLTPSADGTPTTLSWNDLTSPATFNGTDDQTTDNIFLLIPQTLSSQHRLTFIYTMTDDDGIERMGFVDTQLNLYTPEWEMGKRYVYDYTVTPGEVTFVVRIDQTWQRGYSKTIDF